MAEYYAVVRSDECLSHIGVKGMRWGVRKAIQKGNKKKYDKYYKKAVKKLNKLEKQSENGIKYTRKAITKGIKLGATAGLVVTGISNPSMLAYRAGVAGYNAYRATNAKKGTAAQKAQKWRNEMEKEFNLDALYDNRYAKRRKRNRH